ncbi:NAD(P)-dependent oxidoreductase [Pseudolabrys taiwanensis]|uniref:NAD(P)-dependent oxidoreductase n=1 Tax=Pseudolabrys taiwanensis TaxID=331696 RepID=A0A345ZVH1_9HYPH|nr:NAD(P)-dependent oxidoreductase [Pseudolabrys taiwanensis]AXK80918.1 NAD(P)-dependent oxidoreductase [Pseudolabrys taiwanensis]
MQTIGFIGVGKIGLPICQHLLKSGYRVVGYRRSSLSDFEKLGGVAAHSPAEVGEQADIVFTCLPSDEALEEVIAGPAGLIKAARPGQIIVEFGSHAVPVKKAYVAPLAEKGAVFLDGEVSGTPGMVVARKGVIYLSGDAGACEALQPIVKSFAEVSLYLGPFGASTTVKVINNILVGLHIAGTAQAMAIGLRAGVDVDLMIKAIANGSGGSMQFGIRAPWMAERKFMPQQGSAPGLMHYIERGKKMADDVGVDAPLLDCLLDVFHRALPGIGERDVASIIEVFERNANTNKSVA